MNVRLGMCPVIVLVLAARGVTAPPLSVLVPVVPEYQRFRLDPRPDPAYEAALSELLESARDDVGLDGLRSIAHRAATLDAADPRHEYALAVVLAVRRELDAAEARLRAITDDEGDSLRCPVAWMGLVALDASRGHPDETLALCRSFVERLAADEALDDEARADLATWIGRVVTGVSCTAATNRERFEAEVRDLREVWPTPALREAFDLGRQFTLDERARLLVEADQLDEVAAENRERRVDERSAATDEARRGLGDRAEQLKSDLLARTDSLEEAIERVGTEVRYLDLRAATLTRSINLVRTEIARISFRDATSQLRSPRPRSRVRVPSMGDRMHAANVARVNELNGRLERYLAEYVATARLRGEWTTVATALAGEHARSVGRFEQEYGRLTSANVELLRREWKSARQEDSHVRRDAATRRAASLRRRADQLVTYVPFDWEREFQHLLNTAGRPEEQEQ